MDVNKQRIRLAGLGNVATDIRKVTRLSDYIEAIAPINTMVKVECYGRDIESNWICNITLPDSQILNDLMWTKLISID